MQCMITSCFHVMEQMGQNQRQRICLIELAIGKVAVYDGRLAYCCVRSQNQVPVYGVSDIVSPGY